MEEKKKILVTNDDGIDAKGLNDLVAELSRYAEVYVAAPSAQQSAKSQSLTFRRRVGIHEAEVEGASGAYAVDGAPADCVKLGLLKLSEAGIKPDHVISGINMGHNLGMCAYYSGTIAGAREGALNGIRSIALSAGDHDTMRFDYVLGVLPRIMELSDLTDPHTLLSVNAPDLPSWEIKGLRTVAAAPHGYGEDFVFTNVGGSSYQLAPVPARTDDRMLYDYDWVRAGYATVSPIPTSLEDPAALYRLSGAMNTSESLVVIVDAQEGMTERIRKPKRFRRNLGRFVHAAARLGLPVIVTKTYGRGELTDEVGRYAGSSDEFEEVERLRPDAWTSPVLGRLTEALEADRVYIAGAATNIELFQTAAGFISRGYDVTVIDDCCSASDKNEHRTAAAELRSMGCHISTCETAVMLLAAGRDNGVRDSVMRILED